MAANEKSLKAKESGNPYESDNKSGIKKHRENLLVKVIPIIEKDMVTVSLEASRPFFVYVATVILPLIRIHNDFLL